MTNYTYLFVSNQFVFLSLFVLTLLLYCNPSGADKATRKQFHVRPSVMRYHITLLR